MNSQNVHSQASLCEAHLGLRNYQSALQAINDAIDYKYNKKWWLYKRRSEAYFGLQQYKEVLADLNTALELNPTDLSTVTWIFPERVSECPNELFRKRMRQLADKAVELNAWSIDSQISRIRVYAALGQTNEVTQAIENVTQQINTADINTLKESVLNNISWSLSRIPNLNDDLRQYSVNFARRAVELQPDNGNYWNTLGVALYRAGSYEKSIEALQKFADSSYDYLFLAMAEWQLGNHDTAHVWYDQAIDWMKTSRSESAELIRFRDEAEALIGRHEPSVIKRPPTPELPQSITENKDP